MSPCTGWSRGQRTGRWHGRLVVLYDFQAKVISGLGCGLLEGLVDFGVGEGGGRVVAGEGGWIGHAGEHFRSLRLE